MNCPACGHGLSPVTSGGVTVDACVGGCGGIWFDHFELKKVDEAQEAAGEALLEIARQPGREVNRDKRHACPKCPESIILMRHYWSARRQVTVDECPNCGGFWLDEGELAAIRNEFASEADKNRQNEAQADEVLRESLSEATAERNDEVERAQRIARMFRFICPSYYVPGKQEWGAF